MKVAITVVMFLLPGVIVRGQTRRPHPSRLPPPRVGTIKGYPATTGLAAGCGNYYFHAPSYRPEAADSSLVFVSNSDGSYAWMNLDGRDVRLTPVRTSARSKRSQFDYRHGSLRITVRFVKFADGEAHDEDFTIKIRIILRRGRSVRTATATGYADC